MLVVDPKGVLESCLRITKPDGHTSMVVQYVMRFMFTVCG
jgi:hypothetical protein